MNLLEKWVYSIVILTITLAAIKLWFDYRNEKGADYE